MRRRTLTELLKTIADELKPIKLQLKYNLGL